MAYEFRFTGAPLCWMSLAVLLVSANCTVLSTVYGTNQHTRHSLQM